MEIFSKHTYSSFVITLWWSTSSCKFCHQQNFISYKIQNFSRARKQKIFNTYIIIFYWYDFWLNFYWHECEKSTFKAFIGIIYEMIGSEVSQATALRSTILRWFTDFYRFMKILLFMKKCLSYKYHIWKLYDKPFFSFKINSGFWWARCSKLSKNALN